MACGNASRWARKLTRPRASTSRCPSGSCAPRRSPPARRQDTGRSTRQKINALARTTAASWACAAPHACPASAPRHLWHLSAFLCRHARRHAMRGARARRRSKNTPTGPLFASPQSPSSRVLHGSTRAAAASYLLAVKLFHGLIPADSAPVELGKVLRSAVRSRARGPFNHSKTSASWHPRCQCEAKGQGRQRRIRTHGPGTAPQDCTPALAASAMDRRLGAAGGRGQQALAPARDNPPLME